MRLTGVNPFCDGTIYDYKCSNDGDRLSWRPHYLKSSLVAWCVAQSIRGRLSWRPLWFQTKRAMSLVGTKPTWRCSCRMSAVEAHTDLAGTRLEVRVWPKADVSRRRIGRADAITGTNPKTARPFGLEVPAPPLAGADGVIEW